MTWKEENSLRTLEKSCSFNSPLVMGANFPDKLVTRPQDPELRAEDFQSEKIPTGV